AGSGAAARQCPSRRPARRDGDRRPGCARPLLRHEHRAGVREQRRGRQLDGDRELPAGDRLGLRGGGGLAMATVHLPATLPSMYTDLPRTVDVEAATVDEAFERLDARWPGLRDRLCQEGPALRPHINVYVDRERAALDTPIGEGARVDVIAAIS